MEVRQMASGPRQGAKRPVVAPTSARTASAAAATRHAPADPPAKAPEPISRGDGARQRVLRAALDVLDEDGLPGFTMEAVARRAGASKATLYRRWPTVGALLIDAMDATFQPFPVPDSGRVETDLAQLLAAFVTVLEQTRFPRLLAAFIDAAERDPTLAALHADLTRRRREPLLIVLNRARDRGQVPPDLDPEITTDLLAGPSPQTSSTTSSRTYSPPGRQKPPTDSPRTGPLQQARPPGQPAACIAGRLDNDSRPTPRPRERRIHLRLNADAFTPSDLPARSSEHAPYSAKRRPADVVGRSSGNCRPRLRCPVPSTPEFAQKSSRLATNSGEVVRRWRSPAMSIWSVHARRTVPTQRSATGVGPRRLGRDADDLDADGGEHRVEGGTELAVPVAQ